MITKLRLKDQTLMLQEHVDAFKTYEILQKGLTFFSCLLMSPGNKQLLQPEKIGINAF